jgi:hypothetical protein
LRRLENGAYAAALALLCMAPFYLGQYELSLLGRFLAMGILALGIALVWGNGGILTLGQGVFFALGGYAIAMHLKLVALGAGSLPDFMEWTRASAVVLGPVPQRRLLDRRRADRAHGRGRPAGLAGFSSPRRRSLFRYYHPGARAGFHHFRDQPATIHRRLQWSD